jgi:hypothetical protein
MKLPGAAPGDRPASPLLKSLNDLLLLRSDIAGHIIVSSQTKSRCCRTAEYIGTDPKRWRLNSHSWRVQPSNNEIHQNATICKEWISMKPTWIEWDKPGNSSLISRAQLPRYKLLWHSPSHESCHVVCKRFRKSFNFSPGPTADSQFKFDYIYLYILQWRRME